MIAAALTFPVLAQNPSATDTPMQTDPGVERMSRTSPVEQERTFDLGWMGLLGLAGLAGLRKRQTRSSVHGDAEMHRKMGHDVKR